ncbi:MAG: ATP-binding cassette domain-containing protein [Alphaproteobacteria bacterium]|nr:ATP-binding cassette domain-containing protein [Alphaproteobacteria bacterium]
MRGAAGACGVRDRPRGALRASAVGCRRDDRRGDPVSPLLLLDEVGRDFGSPGALGSWLRRGLGHGERRIVRAVDEVTIAVGRQEVVGLVGESGCGKSTLGRIAAGLIAPSRGEVRVDGVAIAGLSAAVRRRSMLRVQMVFQSATASLNPRQTVREILLEPLRVHRLAPRAERDDRVADLMRRIGLHTGFLSRDPHQLSGGQCQRIGIARALTVAPDLVVCDEPVSALDVSIQAQILNLFQDLQESLKLSYLFISHDLSVVERVSDRVAVMYLGRIVEEAPVASLFGRPSHPYTVALLAAAPRLGAQRRVAAVVKGERPSPYNPPAGCHFHPRCPRAVELCRRVAPERREVAPGHWSACHLA